MTRYFTDKPNYDKQPTVPVKGFDDFCWEGWDDAIGEIKTACIKYDKVKVVVAVECYVGVYEDELINTLIQGLLPHHFYQSAEVMKTPDEIDMMVYPDVTDDEIFGSITRLRMTDFFDTGKLAAARHTIAAIDKGIVLLFGSGASLMADYDILVYADMPRWEGQLRFRHNQVSNLGVNNKTLKASLKYKRAFFVDWRVCDHLKKSLVKKWDYILDTVSPEEPKMITGAALAAGLQQTVKQPFRVVPFFDPGPWGGQWMKEVCDLDRSAVNYAWCFDCVPEENSLLLQFGQTVFETPAINAVFFEPQKLLGEPVYARFGDEFPIRFDFLDTMDGGNLSLQVHPFTAYIQQNFGMQYTQDESYYMLDASDDACVYLGLNDEIQPDQMINDLKAAQSTGSFDADKYVKKWPVKKHDHILIPAGTVHCSGKNSMVLEISATPYIFTFKLWDWGRTGLDGKPRPINIEHGKNVIDWSFTPDKTSKELINAVEVIAQGDGWREERTGLHKTEFIETRRHWFTSPVKHHTQGIVNVINLIEGREAIVESPANKFEPFVVHYAETFIIPANVGEYIIRPFGESVGKECATIKAFVRINP